MKNTLLCLAMCLALSSCDQFQKTSKITKVVTYNQLTAQKNYWDSIPGKIKVRDHARPYRYYLNDNPYTGQVEDQFAPGWPKLIGTFKDGYAAGLWKYYQENDSLEQTGSFDNGYVTGEWRFYDRKGKEDTRLVYKVKNHLTFADTLMVVYSNGIRKEWHKDSICQFYANGRKKSAMLTDGSYGNAWNNNGDIVSSTTAFVTKDFEKKATIFYVAHGKHPEAMAAFRSAFDEKFWTPEEKKAFPNANKIIMYSTNIIDPKGYGFSIKVE